MADNERRQRESDKRKVREHHQSDSPITEGAHPVEPRDPAAQPVPRRPSTALLFAIPVVIIVLVGLVWMFFAERDGDRLLGPEGRIEGTTGEVADAFPRSPADEADPSMPTTPPVVSDLQVLANPDLYVGRAIRLQAVPVLRRLGDRTFSAGRVGGSTVVLLDEQAGAADEVMPGQRVDIEGRMVPRPTDAELDRLNLSDSDRQALAGEEAFLHATAMTEHGTIAQPRSHTQ